MLKEKRRKKTFFFKLTYKWFIILQLRSYKYTLVMGEKLGRFLTGKHFLNLILKQTKIRLYLPFSG